MSEVLSSFYLCQEMNILTLIPQPDPPADWAPHVFNFKLILKFYIDGINTFRKPYRLFVSYKNANKCLALSKSVGF